MAPSQPLTAALKAGKPDSEIDAAAVLPPPVPDGWERCHAYMDRKKRFCRQEVVPITLDANTNKKSAGPRYCGNHQHLVPVSCGSSSTTSNSITNNNDSNANSKKRKRSRIRIPCPIDPSHSIFEDAVQKHIPICPLTVKRKKQTEQDFYQRNINIGGYGSGCGGSGSAGAGQQSSEQQPSQSRTPTERLEWAKRVALTVLHVHQNILSSPTTTSTEKSSSTTPPPTTLAALTEVTEDSIHQQVPLQDLSAPEFQAGLREAVASYRIKSGGKRHLRQQASLIGHLRRIGMLGRIIRICLPILQDPQQPEQPPRTFLEVGAGRGMMGLVAAGVEVATVAASQTATYVRTLKAQVAAPPTRLILVERAGSRGKADTVLRQASTNAAKAAASALLPSRHQHMMRWPLPAYMKLETLEWTRIQCDLAHVDTRAILMDKQQQQVQQQTQPKQETNATRAALSITTAPLPTPTVSTEEKRQLVVIAKHLCGAGTDLALKSLEPIKDQVSACVMATCCHGACTWDDYVGRDYLCQAMKQGQGDLSLSVEGFGWAEFELLRRWSAGTVMTPKSDDETTNTASGDKEEEDEHKIATGDMKSSDDCTFDAFDGVGVVDVVEALQLKCNVQGLGRACQRLIDYGRREYLRKVLFADTPDQPGSAELLYYVPADVTPQNAALVAHR
jgi:tRNA:m4X modification enzyme